ncbi:MAG: N-acetyltransferase family protein, partial [Candidatus Sericytochromatia bacterium]
MIQIRNARAGDTAAIWEIFHAVVAQGDTYAYAPDTAKADFQGIWFGSQIHTFVAETAGQLLGSYLIKPNQPGLGDHIANA